MRLKSRCQPGRVLVCRLWGKIHLQVNFCWKTSVSQRCKIEVPAFLLFFNLFIYCIYLFLATLGLRCCAWAFSSCGERGLLFVAVRGLLIAAASLVAEHGLQAHGLQQLWLTGSRAQAQQLWLTGLVAPRHVGTSRTRARTHVPCIGKWFLNHCATREAQRLLLFLLPVYSLISQRLPESLAIYPLPSSIQQGDIRTLLCFESLTSFSTSSQRKLPAFKRLV